MENVFVVVLIRRVNVKRVVLVPAICPAKLEEAMQIKKIDNSCLIQGDCIEAMQMLIEQGVKVDAVITDPPYGTTSCKWDTIIPFEQMWDCLKHIRKDKCPIVLFGSEPFSSYLRISNIREFKYDWIWKKSKSGSAFTARFRPVNKHEIITVFGKGVITYNPQLTEGSAYTRMHLLSEVDKNNHNVGFNKKVVKTVNSGFRYPITVQEFQQKWRRQDQVHPTQKPVALMEYLVKTYTNEGDLVLDFTMGSGTTGVACRNLNRKFIGIELGENYYQIACDRISEGKK